MTDVTTLLDSTCDCVDCWVAFAADLVAFSQKQYDLTIGSPVALPAHPTPLHPPPHPSTRYY